MTPREAPDRPSLDPVEMISLSRNPLTENEIIPLRALRRPRLAAREYRTPPGAGKIPQRLRERPARHLRGCRAGAATDRRRLFALPPERYAALRVRIRSGGPSPAPLRDRSALRRQREQTNVVRAGRAERR